MNEPHPIVSFLFSSLGGTKPFTQDRLNNLIPLSQNDFSAPVQSFWTYQHYFQAIQKVLAKDSYKLLLEATRRQLALSLGPIDVQRILIYSEKHGNWYHPAKIEVITSQGCARFVINVALTERGRAVMSQEIRALKYLAVHFTYPWLPTIYFYNESVTIPIIENETQALSLSLFLADWFEGFHEFHLSLDPVDGLIKMILWDGSPKPNYLSRRQAGNVYFEISKILTLYYNPRTYQQIFPWHHGAGDFVIKLDGKRVEVRLVTVRQYGPLADPEEMSVKEALFFFFLNLSLRMRLDRLDGVGEIAWAGEGCLDSTWEGFQEALRIKEKQGSLTPGFRKAFLKELSRFSEETLTDRFQDLLGSYTPEAPDLPVIKKNIVSHINQVHEIILSLGR
jgi:hypothetical protein